VTPVFRPLDNLARTDDSADSSAIIPNEMKFKFPIFSVLALLAVAFTASSCQSDGDPYGINNPSYYGGRSVGMKQNLIRPGSVDRELYPKTPTEN
jgi:hypothetical protein